MARNLEQRNNQAADGQDQPKAQFSATPLSESLVRLVAAGWIPD